jgi:prophage regulatory protein
MSIASATVLSMPDPFFVGAAEIAELLGVSRQRVDQLTRRPDFPLPIAELVSGRVWVRVVVERWAMLTGRIERTDAMSKWDYKVIRWDALVGPSSWQSLEKNLKEYGAEGWRLDRAVTLEVPTQQGASVLGSSQANEYAVLVRELSDDATTP